MYDRMQTLSKEEMTKIHDASMDILKNVGIAFNEDEALKIFKNNGFKVEGKTVFITENDITTALETAPSRFTLTARNPENNVEIGENDFVFVPGYGAPFVVTSEGEQREATMEDYDNFCKLVQTSRYLDMNGFMMVEPHDIPPQTAHLDMLLSSITLCDRVFMGSPVSRQGIKDCMEMAGIIWGGKDKLKEMHVTVSLINSLSPLQFSDEMAGSLIEMARYNQACVMASLVMAGASGPVTLAGVLALQNAELLSGLTLAQLVGPGTPIIYGSASSVMDMMTGGLSVGAPELSMIVSGAAQLARFYNLPSRGGGGLNDANFPDAQASAESTMALVTAVRNGINFILHACGILGSYIAMSFEKFIIDEEVCGIIRKMIKPIEITDETIDVEAIKNVGIGGDFLTQPKTLELCRTEFFMPSLMNRLDYNSWHDMGKKRIDEKASDLVNKRLAAYEKPDIDPGVEKELSEYVKKRKNE